MSLKIHFLLSTQNPDYLAIPLLSISLKKTKILFKKDVCTLMFSAALLTTANLFQNSQKVCLIHRQLRPQNTSLVTCFTLYIDA